MWTAWESAILWEKWLSAAEIIAEGVESKNCPSTTHSAARATSLSWKGHISVSATMACQIIQKASQKTEQPSSRLSPPTPLPVLFLFTGNLVLQFLFWYFLVVTCKALDYNFYLFLWSWLYLCLRDRLLPENNHNKLLLF